MSGLKLAVIGAGSTYTPELVSTISANDDALPVRELALHDIDAERRDVVGSLAARMLSRQGFEGSLELTDNLDLALRDANAVLIQIRVGGQAARLSDETVPLRCGCIGQETTGAGGFAKAMRTVPVVLEIAERVREISAPDAWIVDFTNPVGIVTRALLDAGHRAVGLCNVAIGFQRGFARILGVPGNRIAIDQVGLNHLTWVRAAWVDGQDALPTLLDSHLDEVADGLGVRPELIAELGAVPSYYLRYFYDHDEVLEEQLEGTPRAQVVAEIERELLELYRDPELDEKPAQLEQRGGAFYSEAATDLVRSLFADTGDTQVIDTRNGDTMPGLAPDDVVEVPARIGSSGPEPIDQAELAPELIGLTRHVAAYERLTAGAAVSRDPVAAKKALLAHPLIGQDELADKLLEKLAEAERSGIPLPVPEGTVR